jgi:hypothetical protein
MRRYNNIHRQQLFYWLGRHIEARAVRGRLTRDLRTEYVACLRDAISNGLWVKKPEKPDLLGDGVLIKVTRPITCFTDWSLGQSLAHTTEYGRLGLGFPKRFALMRGGQPVTYLRDSRRNAPYSLALNAIARWLHSDRARVALRPRERESLLLHFDFLTHFNKRIRRTSPPKPAATAGRAVHPRAAVSLPSPFERRFGSKLHYLEEREWRVVHDESLGAFFKRAPGGLGKPEFYLPFKPGHELFTVVLPDNETVHMAMEDKAIRKAIYPDDGPHVVVLSLDDVGTF